MSVRTLQGDMLERVAELHGNSVDAIVTDPPYGLSFMGKQWDFDVPGAEYWAALLRVAKPGAHLLAFGGTRTYHRMACAIEDAGWEIRDQIGWMFGSGFPKSHNGEWGGTALKPAWEPICMARKPLAGTVEANWRAYGTGALNIDGSRVGYAGPEDAAAAAAAEIRGRQTARNFDGWGMAAQNITGEKYIAGPAGMGRWPANVIHDGSDEVVRVFPAKAGAAAPVHLRNSDKFRSTYGAFAGNVDEQGGTFHGDSGSAARFFYCAKASKEDRDDGLQCLDAKRESDRIKADGVGGDNPRNRSNRSNRSNRNHHPTVKPLALMRYLCRLVTPQGGVILDPFMGSGSTGKAAVREGFDFIGIEIDAQYIEIAKLRIHSGAPLFSEVPA